MKSKKSKMVIIKMQKKQFEEIMLLNHLRTEILLYECKHKINGRIIPYKNNCCNGIKSQGIPEKFNGL